MLILIKRKFFNLLLRILPRTKIQFIRNVYWNLRVHDIHNAWGNSTEDYPVLKEVIEFVKPIRLLDIGCGSGRCFTLYKSLNLIDVTAQDIAPEALKLCKQRFPDIEYKFEIKDIEKLHYPENYFDLIISNRVLSAILPDKIENTIKVLCQISHYIYLNEVSESDYGSPSNYWFMHNYNYLLESNGFKIVKKGGINKQTWYLYTKYS